MSYSTLTEKKCYLQLSSFKAVFKKVRHLTYKGIVNLQAVLAKKVKNKNILKATWKDILNNSNMILLRYLGKLFTKYSWFEKLYKSRAKKSIFNIR